MQVATGGSDLVLAGGAESMSQAEYYVPDMRWNAGGAPRPARPAGRSRARNSGGWRYPVAGGMIETAENVRPRVRHQPRRSRTSGRSGRTRVRSRAIEDGLFDDETIPVVVAAAQG